MHCSTDDRSLQSWAVALLVTLQLSSPLLRWELKRAPADWQEPFVGIPRTECFVVRATLEMGADEQSFTSELPVVESAVAQVGVERYAGFVLHEMAEAIGGAIVFP